jgi:hypothetical protein
MFAKSKEGVALRSGYSVPLPTESDRDPAPAKPKVSGKRLPRTICPATEVRDGTPNLNSSLSCLAPQGANQLSRHDPGTSSVADRYEADRNPGLA